MTGAILSINSGSSSIKFGLYEVAGKALRRSATAKLQQIGIAPRLEVQDDSGKPIAEREWKDGAGLSHEALLHDLFDWAPGHLPLHKIEAVGHRVVHGGTAFSAPVLVNGNVLEQLDRLCSLAPLHQPHNLAAIRAISARAPDLPQVACFDTAFHAGMPPSASGLALPRRLTDQGIRRYGFHGLSYEYVARSLREIDPELAGQKIIAAHLGNGASMCAMKNGVSVDTTMGFTALDGLVMGTRCGSLDPGVVLHLIEQLGMEAREVEQLLYRESGLLGVSGISSDMRALHASDDPGAAEAIELFTVSAARHAAALCASLGGLDALVFTAGIGENDPVIRAQIVARLSWLGIALDEEANRHNAKRISARDSKVAVLVIPTDEEAMIARHVRSVTKK